MSSRFTSSKPSTSASTQKPVTSDCFLFPIGQTEFLLTIPMTPIKNMISDQSKPLALSGKKLVFLEENDNNNDEDDDDGDYDAV